MPYFRIHKFHTTDVFVVRLWGHLIICCSLGCMLCDSWSEPKWCLIFIYVGVCSKIGPSHRLVGGMRWRSWLRHCATSRKFAGSVPDVVIGIFHCHNPSGCTMALGLTQPLTEMSTRNISWGVKAAGAKGWQPYHLHVPIILKSGSLNLLEPSGPVQACHGIALPLP